MAPSAPRRQAKPRGQQTDLSGDSVGPAWQAGGRTGSGAIVTVANGSGATDVGLSCGGPVLRRDTTEPETALTAEPTYIEGVFLPPRPAVRVRAAIDRAATDALQTLVDGFAAAVDRAANELARSPVIKPNRKNR